MPAVPHSVTPRGASKAYAALFIAVIVAGLTAYQAAQAGGISADEWVRIALAMLGPVAVWLAPANSEPVTDA